MMRAGLYGYPDVGRFGLGHSMLAWARCQVWCETRGVRMIGPRWLRVRVGPYIRREYDKREYFRYFTNAPYVRGVTRAVILAASRKVWGAPDIAEEGRRPTVVVFRNASMANFERHFSEIRGHSRALHTAFRQMVRPRYLPIAPVEPFVAVHVRTGDFGDFNRARAVAGAHNTQLPVEWYAAALEALRSHLGRAIGAVVFSDGPQELLAPLLGMPSVDRAPPASPVTHMLQMTDASAIIGAGSNFNLWPAFFEQVPRIAFPGQSFVTVHDDSSRQLIWDTGAEIPPAFVKHVAATA